MAEPWNLEAAERAHMRRAGFANLGGRFISRLAFQGLVGGFHGWRNYINTGGGDPDMRGFKRQRLDAGGMGRGSGVGWAKVGGDPQGAGKCRTGPGFAIFNTPADATLVKITNKHARWLSRWTDKRELLEKMIWPQNLVSFIKDLPPVTFEGEGLGTPKVVGQVITSLFPWNAKELRSQPIVGAAVLRSSGSTNVTQGGIMQTATGGSAAGLAIADVAGGKVKDINSTSIIKYPHNVVRYRIRNTSMRPGKLVIYEFQCTTSHEAGGGTATGKLPADLWYRAMQNKQVGAGVGSDIILAMTEGTGDTWQISAGNTYKPEKPHSVPHGYGSHWRLENTTNIDLKPGKQLLYTTKMNGKQLSVKNLHEAIDTYADDGNIAGFSKCIMVVMLGDSITTNDGTGNFGFGDFKVAMEVEQQFVSSIAWAYRTKSIRLSINAERDLEYYHSIPTATQGGTLSGVGRSFADGGNLYDGNNN